MTKDLCDDLGNDTRNEVDREGHSLKMEYLSVAREIFLEPGVDWDVVECI